MWLWGSGVSGMMGNGIENPSPDAPGGRNPLPVQVKGLTNVTALSFGSGYAAALLRNLSAVALAKVDGTLRMWGHNGFGQLGVGAGIDYYPRPTLVKGITAVSAIYLGSFRSFSVRTDGSLWAWGFGSTDGQGILGKNLRVPTLLELP